jgi:hypothetical protein
LLSSYNTTLQPLASLQKTENGKARPKKAIGICKESQSVQQVLCVNMELCANDGGEVRGDLEDGILLA